MTSISANRSLRWCTVNNAVEFQAAWTVSVNEDSSARSGMTGSSGIPTTPLNWVSGRPDEFSSQVLLDLWDAHCARLCSAGLPGGLRALFFGTPDDLKSCLKTPDVNLDSARVWGERPFLSTAVQCVWASSTACIAEIQKERGQDTTTGGMGG